MTSTRPRRCWINQPSKLQPLHKHHGTNVLATPYREGSSDVYFLSGEVSSMVVPNAVLSEGWIQKEYVLIERSTLERVSRIVSWLECDGRLTNEDCEALPALAEELKTAVQCLTVD